MQKDLAATIQKLLKLRKKRAKALLFVDCAPPKSPLEITEQDAANKGEPGKNLVDGKPICPAKPKRILWKIRN